MTKRWKDINLDFTPQLQAEWEEQGFTWQQTSDWINIGLKPQDANYAYWLAQVVELEPLTMLNEGDSQNLRAEYQEWLASKEVLESLTPNAPATTKANWPWKTILTCLLLALIIYYLSK